MKQCTQCKQNKPLTEFYKNKNHSDGRKSYCKKCSLKYSRKQYYREIERKREYNKQYYQKNKDSVNARTKRSIKKYPEKNKARHKLRHAVRSGKITKEPCEVCGNPKSQGHHEDYTKPLQVKWLCVIHHMELHRKFG